MWLASGGGDGTLAARSLEFLRKVRTVKGHDAFQGGVDFLSFSYDSIYVITGSSGDGSILCRSTHEIDELPAIRSSANSMHILKLFIYSPSFKRDPCSSLGRLILLVFKTTTTTRMRLQVLFLLYTDSLTLWL